MAVYNLTNLTSQGTNIVAVAQELNLLSDRIIGVMFFVGIMAVLLITFVIQGRERIPQRTGFAITMVIGLIVSLLMVAIDFIPSYVTGIMAGAVFISIGAMWVGNKGA